jgi:predicted phage gp36 major capsid-like protein
MTTNTSASRRNALMSIAALAGASAAMTPLAAPAVAAPAVAHSDAELLALGQQLRELFASHDVAEKELLRLDDQLRERLYQAHGRPTYDWAAINARSATHDRLYREMGLDAIAERWQSLYSRMRSVIDAINEANAATVEGLAVKAIVTAYYLSLASSEVARDGARAFIADVLDAAGHQLPPELEA